MTGANFDLNYLGYFWVKFKNSCGYHVANFQGYWINVRSSSVCAPEPEKMAKTKWELTYGTPCSFIFTIFVHLIISIDLMFFRAHINIFFMGTVVTISFFANCDVNRDIHWNVLHIKIQPWKYVNSWYFTISKGVSILKWGR